MRELLIEIGGWATGLLGFLLAMYGVYLGTSGQSIAIALGALVLAVFVTIVGISVAITGHERRKPASLASRMQEGNEDDQDQIH